MAMPSLSLETIQPHVSTVAYNALAKVLDDKQITLLSQKGGINRVYQRHPANIQLEWHLNQANQINGIFLRIYTADLITAYKILNERDDLESSSITIIKAPPFTKVSALNLHTYLAETIFGDCLGESCGAPEHFTAQQLENPDQIQAFFAKNQEMLPPSIRKSYFPTPKPSPRGKSPSAPEKSYNYLYLAGAVLLFLGTVCIAKKYFAKAS